MCRKKFSIRLNPRISVSPWNRVSYGSRPSMGNLGRVKLWRQFQNESFGCPSRASYSVWAQKPFCRTSFSLGLHSRQISVFVNNIFYFVGFLNELWLRRLRNVLYHWREWRLAFINNPKWIVKRWRPNWFICWQLSGQRRMDSQVRCMLTKNSNELWWADPKAMICRSQRVILVRL